MQQIDSFIMEQNEKKYWFVAYTLSRHEKKVAEKLNSMGIECFVATQEEIRQYGSHRKKIQKVILPMTVFIHGTNKERIEALKQPYVTHYLMIPGEKKIATIPDKQMEQFKFMLDYSDSNVELANAPLEPGIWVTIIKGPLTGLKGELIQVNQTTRLILRINILGCAGVEIPSNYVVPIKTHLRSGT